MKQLLLILLSTACCHTALKAQTFSYATSAGYNNGDFGADVISDEEGNVFVTGKFSDSIRFGSLPALISSGSTDIFLVKFSASGTAQWAKKFGGTSADRGTGVKVDHSGNIYLCGDFQGTASFDSYSLTSAGGNDIFVTKLNSSGTAQWAIKGGSTLGDDHAAGIDADNNGNVFMGGNFSGIANYGNNISLTSTIHPIYQTYSVDAFLAKYNSSGTCQWAKKGSSYQADNCFGIATDQNGNSYITGFYGQTADFSGVTMPFQGTVDLFVAGYNTGGDLIYITSPPSISSFDNYEAGYEIVMDDEGKNFYVTGIYDGSLVFGHDTITNHGSYDMFIAKYSTATGEAEWARNSFSTQWEDGRGIALDQNGNVYVAFHYYHSGTPPFPQVTFTSAGYYDPVVVKYTGCGEFVWANRGGSSSYDYIGGLAMGSDSKPWLTGSFGNTATFGSYPLSHSGAIGAEDFYLVQLQSDLITGSVSDTSYCAGVSVAVPFITNISFNSGNVFTAELSDQNGSFENPVSIGTLNGTASGTINAIIPPNTPEGMHYRIRVVSSDSVRNGGDAGLDLAIHGVPSVTISANGNTTLCSGSSVQLNATGNGSTTFQWFKNGNILAGQTSTAFTASDGGDYTCVITNGYGCSFTSNSITVIVNPKPAANIYPGGATTFCTGGSVTFTCNTGNNFSYQWQKNGNNISGATGTSYTATTSGDYTIIITNQYGCSTTSSVTTVTVNAKPAAVVTAAGPTTFCSGSSVVLNANTGNGLAYQWQKNSANISGATSSSYQASNSGTYRVIVSNASGCSKTSNSVGVTKNPTPSATIAASGPTTFCLGDSVIFTANAGPGLSYQWKKDAANIIGATNISYTAKLAGNYKVQVTNQYSCKKTSPGITVTVNCRTEEKVMADRPVIYPNPSTGVIYMTTLTGWMNSRIEVLNLVGACIYKNEALNENRIDLSAVPAGYYIVRLTGSKGSFIMPLEIVK